MAELRLPLNGHNGAMYVPKILLADDLNTNLLVLEEMLEPLQGVEIVKTGAVSELFQLLKHHEFALILLDVYMPEMNGFEIARRIQEQYGADSVPIILITAEDSSESALFRGYESGAVDYLLKPVAPEILRSKVRVFCDIKRKEMIIRGQSKEIERQKEILEREMDERRRIEEAQQESEMRYRTLVELSPEAIAVQVGGKIVYFNGTAMRLLGRPEDETLLGRSVAEFAHSEHQASLLQYLQEVERQGGRGEPIETVFERHDGSTVPIEARAACIMYEGEIGVQVSLQDITERKRLEEELRRLSQLDGLTGIPNRRTFDERMSQEWRRSLRNHTPLSLLMVDVDFFKNYNDTYGHQAGDECVKQVARELCNSVRRPADFVARYGGEEFCVILPETSAAGAMHVARRARETTAALDLEHRESSVAPHVTISIGVATMTPTREKKPDHLLAAADQALYQAKQEGRNRAVSAG